MAAQTLRFNRPFIHLLALSLVMMAFSLACGRCLALPGNPVVHGDETSAGCHTGQPQSVQDTESCKCPSMESTSHPSQDWVPGPLNHETGQGQAALVAGTTLGMLLAAAVALPDDLSRTPPLSLIRRFCIQLE